MQRICPHCGSTDIIECDSAGMISGHELYECNSCGFSCAIFPETDDVATFRKDMK